MLTILMDQQLRLVPNRWNQLLCLVPSPSIKKRGESAGWLSEQGKDSITMSLSLPEHPVCTCIHMQNIVIKLN